MKEQYKSNIRSDVYIWSTITKHLLIVQSVHVFVIRVEVSAQTQTIYNDNFMSKLFIQVLVSNMTQFEFIDKLQSNSTD